jgi:hypothetical protein
MNADLFWASGAFAAMILFGLFLGPIFWSGIIWIGAITFLLGLGALGYQCLLAIHNGYWVDWQFREAFDAVGLNNFSWNGTTSNSVIRWIMALPFGAGLIGAGFLIAWVGMVGKNAATVRQARKGVRR